MAEFMMPVRSVFQYVADLEASVNLRESQYVWSLFEVTHVICMCLHQKMPCPQALWC